MDSKTENKEVLAEVPDEGDNVVADRIVSELDTALNDVFYVVEGQGKTISEVIRMKRRNLAEYNRLLAAGKIQSVKNDSDREKVKAAIAARGRTVYTNLATQVGLPPLKYVVTPAVQRVKESEASAALKAAGAEFVSKIAMVGVREVETSYLGEPLTVEIADYTTRYNFSYKHDQLVLKADGFSYGVIRDLRYSVKVLANAPVDEKTPSTYEALYKECVTLATTHYFGYISFDQQCERLKRVLAVNREIKDRTGSTGIYEDLDSLKRNPEQLMQLTLDMNNNINVFIPLAPVHPAVIRVWNDIFRKPNKALIYSCHWLAEALNHYMYKRWNEGKGLAVGPTGRWGSIQADVADQYVRMYSEEISVGDPQGQALQAKVRAVLDHFVTRDQDGVEELTVESLIHDVLRTSDVTVAFKKDASAGPLYSDEKHEVVQDSELFNAGSIMLGLAGISGTDLDVNSPAAVTAERIADIIAPYRVAELKPKAEVYLLSKGVVRNIIVGSYTSQIPMQIVNAITVRYDRNFLQDPDSCSMMRLSLVRGGFDIMHSIAIAKLKQSSKAGVRHQILIFADNLTMYRMCDDGKVSLESWDGNKAEASITRTFAYICNHRQMSQLMLGNDIVKRMKKQSELAEQNEGRLNVKGQVVSHRKRVKQVRMTKEEKMEEKFSPDARLAQPKLVKKVKNVKIQSPDSRNQAEFYTGVDTPVGWIRYMCEMNPHTVADLNVVAEDIQIAYPLMGSGNVNTAFLNTWKTADAAPALLKAYLQARETYQGTEDRKIKGKDMIEHVAELVNSPPYVKQARYKFDLEKRIYVADNEQTRGYMDPRFGEVQDVDCLGFGYMYVKPDDEWPAYRIPVLQRERLLKMIMFHKFENTLSKRENAENAGEMELTRNLMRLVVVKVAYYIGGHAYPDISQWLGNILKRSYDSNPNLRNAVKMLAESQLTLGKVVEAALMNGGLSKDDVGHTLVSSLFDVIAHPNLDPGLALRVFGHGAHAFVDSKTGVILDVGSLDRIFKNYIPVTPTEVERNLLPMLARKMINKNYQFSNDLIEREVDTPDYADNAQNMLCLMMSEYVDDMTGTVYEKRPPANLQIKRWRWIAEGKSLEQRCSGDVAVLEATFENQMTRTPLEEPEMVTIKSTARRVAGPTELASKPVTIHTKKRVVNITEKVPYPVVEEDSKVVALKWAGHLKGFFKSNPALLEMPNAETPESGATPKYYEGENLTKMRLLRAVGQLDNQRIAAGGGLDSTPAVPVTRAMLAAAFKDAGKVKFVPPPTKVLTEEQLGQQAYNNKMISALIAYYSSIGYGEPVDEL